MTARVPILAMRADVWWPLAAFVVLAILFEVTRVDLWVADALYRWEGGAWTLRRDPVVRDVLHEDAKHLIGFVYGVIVGACVLSLLVDRLSPYRAGLVYLVVAIALSTLSVALLKDVTHVSCPWSIDRYGGTLRYVPHWLAPFTDGAQGRCFPAGHASSGYALLALHFYCRRYAPSLRWPAFVLALACGATFGVAQQLRGAHYLSHDLWALAICWFGAAAATPILARSPGGRQSERRA
jgi:membrane-associated PAP2 superfamily phosphatase